MPLDPCTEPRIVFDGNIFGLQTHGGVSGYAARLFVGLTNAGHRPELIRPTSPIYSGYGRAQIMAADDIRIERIPARFAQYLPAQTGGNVIFHTPYYRRPARRVHRHVVTVHDFTYERFRSGIALRLHHCVKMAAIRAADAVICVSEATRQDVLEYCPNVDPASLHVIHHGVDRAVFFPETDGSLQNRMDRTILFVGQRGGYKRFQLAVEALELCPSLRLAIVGSALSQAEVALLEQKIPGRWTMFGRVDDVILRRLYTAAHGFIFPSDYEGFGLPVLEAMACGCPVVISTDRALREVGGAAVLQAAAQDPEAYAAAFVQLDDSDVRARLRRDGLDCAARASWEKCLKRTSEVLFSS